MRSLVLALTVLAFAGAVHAQVDPTLKLSFAPMAELNAIFARMATIAGKPEKAAKLNEDLKKMGFGEGAGLDTAKRWGAFLDFPKDDVPKAAIVLPVKDEAQFLAGLKPFYPQQEKDGERWKLGSPQAPPIIAQVKDGYGYLTAALPGAVAAPTPILKDPAKTVEGDGTIQIVIEAARLGADLKGNLVPGVKKATGADQAPPDQKAAVDAKFGPMQGQADMAQGVLDPFERLTLSIKVSSSLPEIHFVATEVAKKTDGQKDSPVVPSLGWVTVVNDHGPAALEVDMPLVGRFRQMFEQGLVKVTEDSRKAERKDHQALVNLVDEMNKILAMGRLEGFVDVEGKDGKMTVFCVSRLGPDSELAKKLEPTLAKGPPTGEKTVKSEEGGTTYWAVQSKENDKSSIRSGGVAFGKGLAAFAISMEPNAKDQLKGLVEKLAKATANKEEGIKGFFSIVGMTELGDPFDMKKTDKGKKQFEEMLQSGRDESRLTVKQNADGHRMEIALQGYPVAFVYKEMMKDRQAPGAPPAAPPSPEAAPEPSPEASPAAEESDDGDKEEAEEEEKPKKKKEGLRRGLRKKKTDDDE